MVCSKKRRRAKKDIKGKLSRKRENEREEKEGKEGNKT